ncbi:hypothetical protein POM88_023266 [Heracleum sosnowskyi]|uniref:Uncharacterized protein n=1 Tax=Heracleum sosnowskyi TaxID=360622 RepID=A0AAD8MUD3_9APIA|nr:hypothetical protein POM88_023266 [Heracleum sosnowskyi]
MSSSSPRFLSSLNFALASRNAGSILVTISEVVVIAGVHVVENRGTEIYGWIGREDDYYSEKAIGDFLRKFGDLKTVQDIETEEKSKSNMLLSNLSNVIEEKAMHLKEIEVKYNETALSLSSLMKEKDKKLAIEKEMNERATLEQKKADENVFMLAEDNKREKEEFRKRTMELEKQINAKQGLELEIKRMRGPLSVMKHMENVEDSKFKQIDDTQKALQQKEEELEDVEALNQALVVQEGKTNDEFQEDRMELINRRQETGTKVETAQNAKTLGHRARCLEIIPTVRAITYELPPNMTGATSLVSVGSQLYFVGGGSESCPSKSSRGT